MLEEFEMEGCGQRCGIGECGEVFEIGEGEAVERGRGLAGQLRGEQGLCKDACALDGGKGLAQGVVSVEQGPIAKGVEIGATDAEMVFCLSER